MITIETIAAIQDAVRVEEKVAKNTEGREEQFFTKSLYRPPLPQYQKLPQPATLALHSLTALVSYVENCLSKDEDGFYFIHVESPTKVSVLTALFGESEQRNVLVSATYDRAEFPFDKFQNNEEFVVFLQARFESEFDQPKVLKVIGNIKDEKVLQTTDDGQSQTVIGKAGISLVQELQVPNPVNLAPFRTFPEVEQPASPFILRVKAGQPLPQVALFEADGGAWTNDARENIRKFLAEKLPQVTILA